MSLLNKIPPVKEVSFAFNSLGSKLKIIFVILGLIFAVSSLILLWRINQYFMINVPATGGTLTEGIIGSPRFANPLLAISDADRDISTLVYSGLMRIGPDGSLIPDLAKDYNISPDGLTYTFRLREHLKWQDGQDLTADDVIFTITQATDPAIKSLKRAAWSGVAIQKIDNQTIQFTLKKPYPAFLENTTMGILPKHSWQNTSPESFPLKDLNINPIGSGPYQIRKISKDSSDIPSSYILEPFPGFALGAAKISTLTIKFYKDEEGLINAYHNGEIDSMSSIAPTTAKQLEKDGERVIRAPLPRIFAVFFNQNHSPLFADQIVRRALSLAVDRSTIVNDILNGYGTPITGAFPPNVLNQSISDSSASDDLVRAEALLAKAGWKPNTQGVLEKTTTDKNKKKTTQTLSFSLATADVPELKALAEILKNRWAKMGVRMEVQIYEPGDLNQDIIRPRKYDALLFGEIFGRDTDPFPFWHSSQRVDPGLNIAMYTNTQADKLLEDARVLHDPSARLAKYRQFEQEIDQDTPAAFIYAPYFLYVMPKNIQGVKIPTIANPAERFSDIYNWYIKTDRVWSIFTRGLKSLSLSK